MKGDCNVFWKMLAFSLALQWMDVGFAESDIPESAKPAGTGSDPSPTQSGWKLPEFLTQWKLPETVQVHGFASQSYIHTNGNNFFGSSTDMGSLDFTEMGINGSWRPLTQLQASMQVVYRRAGKTDDSNVRIDFGFLDYSFLSTAEHVLGVRAGRVFNPYGLYNDTRDMPFTRPSILLPQSIYFDVNRNLALSGDGIQFYGENRNRFGDFFLQVNGVYPRTDDPDLKQVIAGNFPGELNGEPSWVGRLMYEWDAGRIRLGVTSSQLNAKYQPQGGPVNLQSGTFSFSPLLFSAQYNAEKWSLTSEYATRRTDLNGFGPLLPNTTFTGESYYVQGSYRFAEKFEAFLRYDVLYWDTSDRNGKKYAAATGQPADRRFAKDITTGLRWDITPSIMARAEYHYINGTGWISELENTNLTNTSQYWSLVALSLSFRF